MIIFIHQDIIIGAIVNADAVYADADGGSGSGVDDDDDDGRSRSFILNGNY